MDSLSEINFNYERAIRQAERLEALSMRLRNAANNDMGRLLNATRRAWRSDSAPLFLRKGEKVEADMQGVADDLKKTARKIRSIAEQVRAAEMEAGRIANEY